MKNRQYNYKTNKQISKKFLGVWIPKHIYLNDNLSWTEKILITEIKSLEGDEGCYASNEYLAKFLQLSEGTIRNTISKLKKKNYIIDNSNNTNSNRLLLVNDNTEDYLNELKQNNRELYETIKVSYDIKYQDMVENNTNIDNNNSSNNKNNSIIDYSNISKKDKEEIIINYEINSVNVNNNNIDLKQEKNDYQLNHENVIKLSQKCDPYIYNNTKNSNSVYAEKNSEKKNKEKEDIKENKKETDFNKRKTIEVEKVYTIKKQIFDTLVPLLLNSKINRYNEETIRKIVAKLVIENKNNLELLYKSIKYTSKLKDNSNPLGTIKKWLNYKLDKIRKKEEKELKHKQKQKEREIKTKEEITNHRINFINSIKNNKIKQTLLLNEQNNNWNKVINNLTKLYGINHYYNWFNRMYLFQEQKIDIDNNSNETIITILCESNFIKDYITKEYLKGIAINYESRIFIRKGIYEFYKDILPNIKEIKLVTIEEILS